jgi:3-oxoacyl-ACP reductase-like protein
MDFSNIIRPALNRITSSCNSYGGGFITRVLSFTGSFNDRTSLLHEPTQTEEVAAAPAPPSPAAAEAAAPAAAASATTTTAAGHPFDIEAGTTTTPLAPTEAPAAEPFTDHQDATESRRVGKSVQTVCLFAASASLVLFVNLPSSNKQPPPPAGQQQHALLYSADMAFISLGFFSSLTLSMFSIVARPGGDGEAAAVARVQKWGMVVAVASVVVAFSLRVCMTLAA